MPMSVCQIVIVRLWKESELSRYLRVMISVLIQQIDFSFPMIIISQIHACLISCILGVRTGRG